MAEEAQHRSIVSRGWRAALFAVTGAVLLLLAIAWIQRRPLVERFVDRELATRGVPARYRIEELGLTEQRLADVVLGDPARPDLAARMVKLRLGWGPAGPYLAGIEARGVRVRVRGRIADGRLSLGAVDRLLPPPSGAPFALPAIAADLADTQLSLETPAGAVTAFVEGRGRLDGGFRGQITLAAPVLAHAGCTAPGAGATLAVAVTGQGIGIRGPARAARVTCAGAAILRPQADIDVTLAPALDGWSGNARLAAASAQGASATLAAMAGTLRFDGDSARTQGRLNLTASGQAAGITARRVTLDTGFVAADRLEATGMVALAGARYPLGTALAPLEQLAGTPVAPIAASLRTAIGRAAADFGGQARFRYGDTLVIEQARLASASGMRGTYTGMLPAQMEARLEVAGGGLPSVRARISGDVAQIDAAPLAAGGARLALAPVRLTRRGQRVAIDTRVTLDGPVAGGRVTGLSAPLSLMAGPEGVAMPASCLPVALARLEIAGFDFRDTRASACLIPGGVRVADITLAGTSGDSPARVTARSLRYAGGAFSAGPVTAAIGADGRRSSLMLATIDGRVTARGLAGRFTGASGSIAAVPVLASDGAGGWTLADGALDVAGALRVADADPAPRFEPLLARDFRLTLADGRIRAGATLAEPASGIAVTGVTIRHDLASAAGDAVLAVPGITFDDALQPERLTRLTLGVIANVRGTIRGEGRIRWDAQAITSDGDFETDGIDLAAAFGPANGIRGRIHFSDLLALATPPGQEVTIAEANPGVAVTGGLVRYQLLPDQIVRIEGGRWPFAGGTLSLQPEMIDLNAEERRLTFAVEALDAGRFVERLEFENIAATGTFDGTLPLVFDQAGGRIVGGRLVARDGGGTLAYVGELTQAQLGTFGKLAFDALKSIRYRNLAIQLDGALDGEIVSKVSFSGVNQEPLEGMKTPFRQQLKGLPFIFNITVRAPFRGLIGSARAFADPTLFIRERIATQPLPGDPVQPADSANKP